MMKTITRADVAEILYQEVGLSRKDSGEILDMVLEEIVNELAAGSDVKLSSFGTFALRDKKPRIGRNPKTGVEAEILRAGSFPSNPRKQCAKPSTRNKHGRQQIKSRIPHDCLKLPEELGVGTHVRAFGKQIFSAKNR